jgi:hypothetical protein
MALQPAAGARDLNPRQVETNRNLTERLARVFRLWGYDEVSPPRVERMKTLMAGGAIASRDIVRLVADDPLGLRPRDDGFDCSSSLHATGNTTTPHAFVGGGHRVSIQGC